MTSARRDWRLVRGALPLAAVVTLCVLGGGCADKCGGKRCETCDEKAGLLGVDRCADIRKGAIPQPTGTVACQWQNTHAEQAEQDDLVIYEHEWREGGKKLGPFGQKHIEQIVRKLTNSPHQVIIEPHFDVDKNRVDAELNEARRRGVVVALAERGVADAEERVVVAWPKAEGLYGEEAVGVGIDRTSSGTGRGGTVTRGSAGLGAGFFGGGAFLGGIGGY
jgi:hypothetical protein